MKRRECRDRIKARNPKNNESVMLVKVKNAISMKRVESQLDVLKECECEFLMRYIDAVKKDDALWVVMECGDCISVDTLTKQKNCWTEDALREIASGCLLGLEYLHKKGIAHGDVRPVNLFLSDSGTVKLGCYGLTTQVDCYSEEKAKCEGIRSFAPEVFEGKYELKSDVWSLGLALMRLARVEPLPEDDDDLPEIVGSYHFPFGELKGFSDAFVDFVKKCLVKEVNERWSMDALMNHPFVKSVTRDGCCGVLATVLKGFHHQQFCKKCLLDVENAFLVLSQKEFDWVCEGIVKKPSSVVMELDGERVIEVSIDSHEVLSVKEIEHAQVLNLSDDGERWEGDVLHNEPYGWGVVYDSENRMAYEGFRIGDVNVCYGTQYYSDIQKVEYEGEWYEGKRWGRGIQYDRNGSIVFDGEWMNDSPMEKRVVISQENQLLHNHVEELIVSDECCNGEEWRVLDLSLMPNLRELRIGNQCFKNVDEMKLIGLDYLEKVEIGNNCFVMREYEADSNRHFVLKDCERLRELKIGCGSFMDYCTCEIESCDALEVVQMGDLEVESACFFCGSLKMKSE